MTKPTRGGPQPGSGRPHKRKDDDRVRLNTMVAPGVHAWLKEQAGFEPRENGAKTIGDVIGELVDQAKNS